MLMPFDEAGSESLDRTTAECLSRELADAVDFAKKERRRAGSRVAYWAAVWRRPVASAFLLAAWLLPLAAQVGVMLHLLDAGLRTHSSSMVEVLVHGHPHPGRVPSHGHTIRQGPAAETLARSPASLAAFAARPSTLLSSLATRPPGLSFATGRTLASAPLRYLLLGVLLR